MYNIDILFLGKKQISPKILKMVKEIASYTLESSKNKTRDKNIYELSIVFSDKYHITKLNKKYFGRNYPTDVIAFPQLKGKNACNPNIVPLGDIVICQEVAKKQSREYNVSFEYEILNLVVHGILHLLGEKDTASLARSKMLKKQDGIVKKFYEQKKQ